MFSVSWVYPNKREIGVVDKRKNILWKYNIIKNVDVMTKLSPYGDYLVVDIDGEIHYFDKKGNLLWKKPYISDIDPNMGAEVATTEKGKYIVITQDFKSGAILDFIENNGEIIWHFNLPERSDHLCVSEKGKYIITTGHDGIGKWNKNIYFIKNTAISADE